MLQGHAARWASDAGPVQAHLDDPLAHTDNLDITPIGLDVRPEQVHDLAHLSEQGIMASGQLWRRHAVSVGGGGAGCP